MEWRSMPDTLFNPGTNCAAVAQAGRVAFIVEESYEVIDAIDRKDRRALAEEPDAASKLDTDALWFRSFW